MADAICGHCGESWDVTGLSEDGWGYFDDDSAEKLPADQQTQYVVAWDVSDEYTSAERVRAQAQLSEWVRRAVLKGQGCPACGFSHTRRGRCDEARMHALVFEGVTDEDPMEFLL